jgi:ribokinase
MNNILVCGLTNIETMLKVNNFPIEYSPIEYNFFGTAI